MTENTKENMEVRVRFAPSPTGALHIGGVRTALYNYLFARHHGGKMLLRIEDTDSARFVPGAEAYIIEALEWLGIRFDEGVSYGGDNGPYRQSERKAIYRQYVQALLDEGKAYIAFDTPEELAAKREAEPNFQYDAATREGMRNSLTLGKEKTDALVAGGHPYVVRMKIAPGEDIRVDDLIRGEVHINSSILDDKVLWKSTDGLPTYHLANIVDDHLMKITHVIRGEEWLPSAPLHVLLYRALGWADSMPKFAHLPLLLKPEGKGKLSKRDGDRLGFPVFPLDWTDPKTGERSSGYREAGYFPEAVVNFLALLGWNAGTDEEFFGMEDLVKAFSLERISKSGARFDYEKARWFNHHYLGLHSDEDLLDRLRPTLKEHGVEWEDARLLQAIGMVKDRAYFVKDLWTETAYFYQAPTAYEEKGVKKWWKPETAGLIGEWADFLETRDFGDAKALEEQSLAFIAERGYKNGAVLNPARLALLGEMRGPHLFDILALLGREESLARLRRAVREIA